MGHMLPLTIGLVLLPSRAGPATHQSGVGASGHVTVTSEMTSTLGWPCPPPQPPRPPRQLPLDTLRFVGQLLSSVAMEPEHEVLGPGGVASPVAVQGAPQPGWSAG